jgi:hypothetical protein
LWRAAEPETAVAADRCRGADPNAPSLLFAEGVRVEARSGWAGRPVKWREVEVRIGFYLSVGDPGAGSRPMAD